jgi:heme/copper-type cytochrome/quinol oxidase subunit 3
MAHAPAVSEHPPAHAEHAQASAAHLEGPPVTPGKVAMWLFLATEIMFFTGLIGSYVVLRAGSPPTAYSNLYSPATDLEGLQDKKGVLLTSVGPNESKVVEIIKTATGQDEHEVEHFVEAAPHLVAFGLSQSEAGKVINELSEAGAKAEVEPLKTYSWPQPYDNATNPLSIDLTAVNTFILICSSVTMVLALGAIQRGDKAKLSLYLLATVLIGSVFLSIQVYEYNALMRWHVYPPGISATTHYRPSVSLFASCFFTMTGFHGAHVTGGVILLTCILIQSLRGQYTQRHHSPVELAGLYWHFVDLVWIILFTVVYLV